MQPSQRVITKEERSKYRDLAKTYCHQAKNVCPMCASRLVFTMTKKLKLNRCFNWPLCRGFRFTDGIIGINEPLILFIDDKMKAENPVQETRIPGRFADL